MTPPILDAVLICPRCGSRHESKMPEDACLYIWDCPACGARLEPKAGDCCVFCSYGSSPCPPMQAANRDAVAPRRKGRLTADANPTIHRQGGNQPE
ncbi:MAG TPA: GDCCVxC domain-containing (seleno)protein [Alphaproteobacteria bacterium]|nr:GDCCVxC domain-containing (seleno)protein [Alphaproteobacteria bacterium]